MQDIKELNEIYKKQINHTNSLKQELETECLTEKQLNAVQIANLTKGY